MPEGYFWVGMAVVGHRWVCSWCCSAEAMASLQAPLGSTGPSADPRGWTSGGCGRDGWGQLCPIPVPIGASTGASSHATAAGYAGQPMPTTDKRHRVNQPPNRSRRERCTRGGKPPSFGCDGAAQPVRFCASGSALFILFPASENSLRTPELGVCAGRDGRSQAGGERWKGSPGPASSPRAGTTASPCAGSPWGFAERPSPQPSPPVAAIHVLRGPATGTSPPRSASRQPQQVFHILGIIQPTSRSKSISQDV